MKLWAVGVLGKRVGTFFPFEFSGANDGGSGQLVVPLVRGILKLCCFSDWVIVGFSKMVEVFGELLVVSSKSSCRPLFSEEGKIGAVEGVDEFLGILLQVGGVGIFLHEAAGCIMVFLVNNTLPCDLFGVGVNLGQGEGWV